MSKNIILNGAKYRGVSSVVLPTENGTAKFKDEDEIITPSGTLDITINGERNVAQYEKVNVNVSGGVTPTYQEKTVTPTAAGFTVTPGSGFDGLSSVEVCGDSNLVAENIKEGVTIFGVTGTFGGESGEPYALCDYIAPSGRSTTDIKNAILLPQYNLNNISLEIKYYRGSSAGTTTYTLLGYQDTNSTGGKINNMVLYSGDNYVSTYSHDVTMGGSAARINVDNDVIHTIKLKIDFDNLSINYIVDNDSSQTFSYTTTREMNGQLALFSQNLLGTSIASFVDTPNIKISEITIYDDTNVVIGNFKGAIRNSDNAVGLFDEIKQTFITSINNNASNYYSVGNWGDV